MCLRSPGCAARTSGDVADSLGHAGGAAHRARTPAPHERSGALSAEAVMNSASTSTSGACARVRDGTGDQLLHEGRARLRGEVRKLEGFRCIPPADEVVDHARFARTDALEVCFCLADHRDSFLCWTRRPPGQTNRCPANRLFRQRPRRKTTIAATGAAPRAAYRGGCRRSTWRPPPGGEGAEKGPLTSKGAAPRKRPDGPRYRIWYVLCICIPISPSWSCNENMRDTDEGGALSACPCDFLSAACPWNVRVGANSPSLWPDHVLGDEHGHELPPVVHGEGEADQPRAGSSSGGTRS